MDFVYLPKPILGKYELSPDGRYAGSIQHGKPVFYNLSPPLALRITLASECELDAVSVAFRTTPEGCTHAAVLGDDQSTVTFVELPSGKFAGTVELLGGGGTCMAFANNGDSLYVGNKDGNLFLVNLKPGENSLFESEGFVLPELENCGINRLVSSPLGKEARLIYVCEDGRVAGFSEGQGAYDYPSLNGEDWDLSEALIDDEKDLYAFLRRDGEIVVVKDGYSTFLNLQDSQTAEEYPVSVLGIATSKDSDLIVFTEHDVLAVDLDLSDILIPDNPDDLAIESSEAFEDAGQPISRLAEAKLSVKILASYNRNIHAVVQADGTGRVLVLYE